ncbi:MAG: VOC family protein, partial [Acidobacteriota bacterium]
MKTKIVLSGIVAAICLAASAFLTTGAPPATPAVSRPPILGIANVALRVSNADEAHHFFGQVLGFDRLPLNETAHGKMKYAYYKVNDNQYIKISPTQTSPSEDGLIHIAYRTTDARALRSYLAAHGVTVPASVEKDAEGDLSFNFTDPAGHQVQFIQYLPGSVEMRNKGKYLAPGRVSHEIIHAGETVADR